MKNKIFDTILCYLYCNIPILREQKRENNSCNVDRSMHEGEENVDETEDLIRIKTDIILTDKYGNIIEVNSLQPEYMLDSLL